MSLTNPTPDEAFILRILASPIDRLPRLVYADWLEEQADPRAEYLRLQCQVIAAMQRLAELNGYLPRDWTEQIELLSQVVTVLTLPALGHGVESAKLNKWCSKPGQRLTLWEDIAEFETEKASFVLPVVCSCIVFAHLAHVGQVVTIGGPLALLLRV